MNLLESLRVAIEGLMANKMRSALTMLGVIIGVSAVILLVSIGQGAKIYVAGEIEGLGSNVVFVIPGRVEFGQGQGGHPTFTNKLTLQDAQVIAKGVTSAEDVAAVVQASADVKYLNQSRTANINGVTASYPKVINAPTVEGRFFSESQVSGGRAVCTLGKTLVDDFFGHKNPIGERITIAGQKFTVIGVMESRGQMMGVDQDNVVYSPITTAQRLFGIEKVNNIVVSSKNPDSVSKTISEVEKILSRRLDKNDFSVHSQGEMLGMLQEVLGTLTLMLAGIAGISLLVGGIGIMNIMLVSVTERTREIGIRKAVGARTYDILVQFVIEAVALSISGGMVGIILGAGGSALINRFLPSQVTIWSVLMAFTFSAAVGIFFGVYPAYKASRLDPIAALRYE